MPANRNIKTGMQVEIEFVNLAGSAERLVLAIVPDRQADFAHGLLGESTPLAQALMGHSPGEELPYSLDDIVKVRILAARLGSDLENPDAAAQREEAYRQAVADLEKRNAAAFAASFSGKWGDYDPGAVEEWDKTPKPEDKS